MDMLEAVKQIVSELRANNIYPDTAPIVEVKRLMKVSDAEFKRQGSQLKKKGIISLHRTINGYSIILNEDIRD